MATSSHAAGRFLLLGSAPATSSSLVACTDRHVNMTMLMFPAPAGFLPSSKGIRLAVAAGAKGAGSADHPLSREAASSNITFSPAGPLGVHGALAGVNGVIAAGAPPREQVKPVGFLLSSSNSKGARLPVVVAAGTTSPGESDDDLPSEDCEAPGGDRDLKSACAKDGADPPSMGAENEFDKMYKDQSEGMDEFLGLYIPLPNLHPMSKEEKAVQEKLKEIAEKCIALIHDAMRRLPPAQRRRLVKVFWPAHLAFAIVRSRATDGRASLETAVVIAEKLYLVLKMVSSGSSTPLPLDVEGTKRALIPFTAPVFPLDHGVEVFIFKMIDDLYAAVKRDIEAMLSDESRR